MKIEDRRCGKALGFDDLEIGDVFAVCGSFFYMKTEQATKGCFDTNTVCLNDGGLKWTEPNRVVEKVNAKVVIE